MIDNLMPQGMPFVDKANNLKVPFDADRCIGRAMGAPVMFTPAIFGVSAVSVAFGAGVWIGVANAR